VTELPINKIIFEAITGESPFFAYLLALMVSLLFAFWGHAVGSHARFGQIKKYFPVHLGTAALVILTLAGLAYVRIFIFSDPGETELGGSGPMLGRFLLENMDVRAIGVLFLLLNILLVIVAGILAYESHDPDIEYHSANRQYQRWSRKTAALTEKRERAKSRYTRRPKVLIDNCQELLHHYRAANLEARTNRTTPQVWLDKSPERLISIDMFDFQLMDNEMGGDNAESS